METYDVAVLGGGIHGVGVAQAASAAGYKTVLLEKTALGSGTSSRSSKLIHGGLRYLETGQLQLVRQNIQERELLLQLAPDLIHRLAFHIPLYDDSHRSAVMIRLGLKIYDGFALRHGAPKSSRIPKSDWDTLDGLETNGLQHVFRFYDAQTNDADLTRTVMRSACALGAELLCPAHVTRVEHDASRCLVHYHTAASSQQLEAHVVINALGPWILESDVLFEPDLPAFDFEKVAGTHIECAGFGLQSAYYVEATDDHRGIFILPWGDRTLIGTTEDHVDALADAIQPSQGSIEYLQRTFAQVFPRSDSQTLIAWAGFRVLPRSHRAAFFRSRETSLLDAPHMQPRIVSILGGKLTGYRLTAQRVMQHIQPWLPKRTAIANTATLPLTPT